MQRVTPAAAGSAAAHKAAGRFVINLMSSTTPMALAQPNHPSLKQYAFFITRRRQDRSERFRLHMGYFDSQQQAEAMLVKVRQIFPSAWAGIAPGNTEQKQAAERRSVTAASYELAHVPVPMPPTPKPAATKAAVPEPAVAAPAPAPASAAVKAPAATMASAQPAAQTVSGQPPQTSTEHHAAAQSLQSVRAAINALDDGAEQEASLEDTSATAQLKALTETAVVPTLNDSQVLKVLEPMAEPPAAPATVARTAAPGAAPRTKPVARVQDAPPAPAPAPAAAAPRGAGSADAGKDKDKDKDKDNPAAAPGGFAVQLQWSASPIDIAQLPYLAIFEAYTLYIAEGKREDRRWYGLRLGFFSDGASAKQVAQYLRSEFSSVVVVPISARERDRAKRASKAVMPSAVPETGKSGAQAGGRNKADDYQLLDVEVATGRVPKSVADAALKPELSKELQDLASNPVKTTAHKAPLTLEETLEILGANNLAVQDKNSEMLNNSAVRSLRRAADAHVPEKRSALGKLFERLGESLGR